MVTSSMRGDRIAGRSGPKNQARRFGVLARAIRRPGLHAGAARGNARLVAGF